MAHPDDESFGLGAVLDRLTTGGATCSVLCFTRGESSTLHHVPGELAALRAEEFAAAAAVLGLYRAELRGYPDGGLSAVPVADLADQVCRVASDIAADHLLAFDIGGVTGHPDHARATEAAISAGSVLGVPVLGWALPETVAQRLNAEFGAAFSGRGPTELDQALTVDRARQWRAIRVHASQSTSNNVLRRRLQLLGDREHVRLLREHNVGVKETVSGKTVPLANEHQARPFAEVEMNYGIKTRVRQPYAAVVSRVREALKEQGFGVLTEIDVKATLREKLGEEMEDFVILGACNPPLAHRALQADRQIGLLLPCNVVVRAAGGETIVEALDPQVMADVADRPELKPIADEAARRIRSALAVLGAEPASSGQPVT